MVGDIQYSVCSTHYNNVEYIEDSAGYIASIIKNREDWELVISDAGSDDGSLEYLQNLSEGREDIKVVMAEGSSIGKGRQVALDHSRGEVVISLGDLDAVYYHDNRLFDFVSFYEKLVKEEGDIMLAGGAMIASRKLYYELGGWNDLQVTERRDLKRRALAQGKLRFCNVLLHKENAGKEKEFVGSIKRFYNVARMKLKSGIGLEYLIWRWMTDTSTLKPKIGALLIFPTAWLVNKIRATPTVDSFNRHDTYAFDFQRSLQREVPDIWLEPSGDLEEYV